MSKRHFYHTRMKLNRLKNWLKKFELLQIAITFAEAGEVKTAQHYLVQHTVQDVQPTPLLLGKTRVA
jgi:hypothetical protein